MLVDDRARVQPHILDLAEIMAFSNIMLPDPALVLGTVAAHEVGHFLLPRQGHSTEGLMRASWKPDDWERAASGFLLFSPPERMAVRKRVSDCREGG